jgi:hypothetical protein
VSPRLRLCRRYLPTLAIALVTSVTTAAHAQISGGSFAGTGADLVPRYFHRASKLRSGDIMVTGGLGLQLFPPSLFSRDSMTFYSPGSGTFTSQFTPGSGDPPTTPTLLEARSAHSQTSLLDGRILIVGGFVGATGTSQGTPTSTVEVFDPVTGGVTSASGMSVARASHTATLLPEGGVVVAGGASWQVFTPGADTWSPSYSMLRTRSAHAAVLLTNHAGVPGDHRVLLIGGAGSGADTLELLDPANGTSTLLVSALTVGVDDLAAVGLADGDVFIAGGQDVSTGDTVANCYVLDPVSDVLTPAPDVPNRADGISDHQIVRFGRYVCIFGGEQEVAGVDTELDYAAIFDSVAGAWFSDGSMGSVHDDFASVALSGCDLLLIDGGVPFLGQEAPSTACEIFTLTVPGGCVTGDVDNDGDVDLDDAAALTAVLIDSPLHPDHIDRADLNEDGPVDGRDIVVLVDALLAP